MKLRHLGALLAIATALALDASAGPPRPPLPPLPNVSVQVVHEAPPAPRAAVVVTRPGPDYVWTDGSWDWRDGRWAWADGTWQHPPARRARWVRARYVRVNGGWEYVPGHWSTQRVVTISRRHRY